jgi:hypothetical protein
MDTKRFQRFTRPGHAVTGDRFRTGAEKRMRVGHEFVHSIVDDHSRLAYSELHRDERAPTVTAFLGRVLDFFAVQGIEAKRLQTDNAFAYVHNRSLRELLAERCIEHRRIPAQTPSATGRWSATSRRSSASGGSGSATAHPNTEHSPCHTGSGTTTRRGDTQRSGTARPSTAFGTC